MKARIIKTPSGVYQVQRCVDGRWLYVNDSTTSTLESAELKLRLFVEVGEPTETVIREVEY